MRYKIIDVETGLYDEEDDIFKALKRAAWQKGIRKRKCIIEDTVRGIRVLGDRLPILFGGIEP